MDTMKTRSYPITEAEAKASINRRYNSELAWAAGIRGWNTGGPQPAIACTYAQSPRTPGAYREIPYGNDESYKLVRMPCRSVEVEPESVEATVGSPSLRPMDRLGAGGTS